MQIKRLRNTHFGTKKISRVVTGWALYEPGKGWVAFSADRDEFGILIPYIPVSYTHLTLPTKLEV